MRISAGAFLRSTVLLALTGGLLLPDASAGNVTIGFGGFVNGAGTGKFLPTGLAVNDPITGSFGYNPLQAGSQGLYSFGASSVTPALAFAISFPLGNPTSSFGDSYAKTLSPNTFTIQITDTGTKGATLLLTTNTTGAGFSKPGGAFVTLTFTSSTYTGVALPQTMAAFDAAFGVQKAAFLWDPEGPGVGGVIDQIDGNSITPEPSSFILLGVAMATGGIGLAISRRKRLHAS